MHKSKLRVAFASGVRHAAPYLEILSHDQRVEIIGVGEEPGVEQWMLDAGEQIAKTAGVPWHIGFGDWFSPDDIDLVIVCSEPTRHTRLASEALKRGLDVLVDKPAAVTLPDVNRLVEEAQNAGRVCAVINRTHAPALRRLRSWVEAGHMGLPLHLDMEFFASGAFFSSSVERPELVVDSRLSGGGEMMNFLGYAVDAIHYVTGLEVKSIYAMTGNLFSAVHAEHGVEDTAVVSLEMEYGVTGTITVGRIPYAPGLGATTSSLRVLGSHAHAVADDDRPALSRFGGGDRVDSASLDGGQEALRAYLGHVVTELLSGGTPDYDIVDARRTISVIDAAYQSVDQKMVVALAPTDAAVGSKN